MSELRVVREALQGNPNIVIVDAPEINYLPGRNGLWSHIVDFYVAPHKGLYTAPELQTLMVSLVPELRPINQDDFYESVHEIGFGRLCFDEVIGTENIRREITLTDKDMFPADDPTRGRWVVERTEDIWRRIWVRLFPNAKIAAAALKGKHELQIFRRELPQYRGIVERLVGALS